ncbi:hypothetical protein NQD34_001127 [Periophthalmus magnuspinnatus]|nr:hypothetical protein NQD34_001127 [Periophthalmus magnuspinnatus]
MKFYWIQGLCFYNSPNIPIKQLHFFTSIIVKYLLLLTFVFESGRGEGSYVFTPAQRKLKPTVANWNTLKSTRNEEKISRVFKILTPLICLGTVIVSSSICDILDVFSLMLVM